MVTVKKVLTGESLVEEYKKTHPGSLKLHEKAVKLLPADGATHAARILDPFRPYITHATGSRKWDIDGNEYICYVMGHGSLILGHSHPAVVQAVQEQITKGVHYGENHALEVEWAELISSMMPVAERIEFCACGQEANIMAIRLARIYTGRSRILRFDQNYHGWSDEVAIRGTAGALQPEVTIIPMNDLDAVEKELAKKEYAILFNEGGGGTMAGGIPWWNMDVIHALSGLTKKYGTLWHIDEVVTGFRDSRGGWQERVRVKPDLTSLGKCVGGGIPVGAVVGRADIMKAFDPHVPPEKQISHAGTWNSNPVQGAGGVAACKLYLDGAPQKKAYELGSYLRDEGNKILKGRNISGRLYGRTIVHLYLGPIEYEPSDETLPPSKDVKKITNPAMAPIKARLCLHLMQRGVATMGARFFVMSSAHTKDDIDQTIEALDSSLEDMVAEGAFKTA